MFARMLADRYGEFAAPGAPNSVQLEIELLEESDEGPGMRTGDNGSGKNELRSPHSSLEELGLTEDDEDGEDLSVRLEAGRWVIERGSYRAKWDPKTGRGSVRQTANPYAIDGVLRILHSLILAREGGFLVHAASAVRNGQAFVFAGISGTGKTTLARLAPPDVVLLTDEISYIRQETGDREQGKGLGKRLLTPDTCHLAPAYQAFGTPFAGELARIGRKMRAPLAALFLLQQGPENLIEPLSEADAVRELLRHVLFFARDEQLVHMVFLTVCDFVRRVPVRRLVFAPDARVWELIS